jgi:hypothetical protein
VVVLVEVLVVVSVEVLVVPVNVSMMF